MSKLIGLVFLVFGCKSLAIAPAVSPELISEVAAFNDEFGVTETNITVKAVSRESMENIGGVCHPEVNAVLINANIWSKLGPYQRKHLLWHELLHCQFHIDHVEATFDNGKPQSIMFPYMMPHFTEQFLRDHWLYYVQQAHSMIGNPAFSFDYED